MIASVDVLVALRTVAMREAGLTAERCGILAVVGRVGATGRAAGLVAGRGVVAWRIVVPRGAKSIKRPRLCG